MQNKIIYSVFCFSIIYNFICTQCLQGKATHIKSTSTSSRDQTILWLWSLFLSVWIFLPFTFTNSFNFTFAILHQLAVRMTSVVLLSYWSQISVRGLSLVLSLFGLRTKEKSLLCYSPTHAAQYGHFPYLLACMCSHVSKHSYLILENMSCTGNLHTAWGILWSSEFFFYVEVQGQCYMCFDLTPL